MVVPESFQQEVLTACHDNPTGGHFGSERTYETVRLRYYWRGLYNDVKHWCSSCTLCYTKKSPKNKVKGKLIPIEVAVDAFYRVGIDIVGPLPKTTQGNKYIVVMTDYLTKYPEAVAVSNITAQTVARVVYDEIMCRHGAPSVLLSDRGAQFLSELVLEMCKIMGIKKATTSSYNPKCNGLTERFNGTLIQSLAMYTGAKQDDWDQYITSVLFAYRVSRATSSTHLSPFFLLHGRHPKLPIDTALLVPPEKLKSAGQHLKEIIEKLEVYQTVAKENIRRARDKMQKHYDKNAKHPDFESGDHVWIYAPYLKKKLTKKLLHLWHGPMYLVEKITPVTFRVRNANNKLAKGPVHVNRMKTFIHRNDRPIGAPTDTDDSFDLEEDDLPPDSFAPQVNGDPDQNDPQNSQNDANIDDVNNDDVYDVEEIVKKRTRKGKIEYLIKWEGYDASFNTWEPANNIIDKSCITTFEAKQTRKRRGRPPKRA